MPLLFPICFLCSKRERMRKHPAADSAAPLMSGLPRRPQAWAWPFQARAAGYRPRPQPCPLASSPSPTPPSTTSSSTPTNLFPRRPLPPKPRNTWGETLQTRQAAADQSVRFFRKQTPIKVVKVKSTLFVWLVGCKKPLFFCFSSGNLKLFLNQNMKLLGRRITGGFKCVFFPALFVFKRR